VTEETNDHGIEIKKINKSEKNNYPDMGEKNQSVSKVDMAKCLWLLHHQ
jgi:hypothetical protein